MIHHVKGCMVDIATTLGMIHHVKGCMVDIATTLGMIHHVKGCMVDIAPDIVLFHYSKNDLKKYLTPQKITQNILNLAEEVSDRGK